jgi:hypothetical protein
VTTPAYTFRHLDAAERDRIGKAATTPPAPPVADDAMQRAWEADLAAHQAMHKAATSDEAKARHAEAIRTLVAALTKSPR